MLAFVIVLVRMQVRDYRATAPTGIISSKPLPVLKSSGSKKDGSKEDNSKGGKDEKKKGKNQYTKAAELKAAAAAAAAREAEAKAARAGMSATEAEFGVVDGPPRDVSFVVLRPTSESVAREVAAMAAEEDWSYEEMLVRGITGRSQKQRQLGFSYLHILLLR